MLKEIVCIRNFVFPEKIQILLTREKGVWGERQTDREREQANVKSSHAIYDLYTVECFLGVFFLEFSV